MDTSASNRRLRTLLTGIRNGELVPRPDFQRRLVWNNKDKNLFIQTVLEGLPFPEIYIAAGKVDSRTGEGSEVLVDGQQRISTLFQYFTDSADLRLSVDIPKYSSLPEDKQIEFLEYKVVVRDLGALPIDQIKTVFQRINSTSYGLNAMEMNNSRYAGAFKQLADWLASQDVINKLGVFSANDVRRMNDLRYCSAILASILGPYFNRDKEIEDFLAKYDEYVPEEDRIRASVTKVLDLITAMNFPKESRARKKSDFFTLFVELYRHFEVSGKAISASTLRQDLDEFFLAVDAAGPDENSAPGKYYRATLQASNDRQSRITRGEIISGLIDRAANKTVNRTS